MTAAAGSSEAFCSLLLLDKPTATVCKASHLKSEVWLSQVAIQEEGQLAGVDAPILWREQHVHCAGLPLHLSTCFRGVMWLCLAASSFIMHFSIAIQMAAAAICSEIPRC